MIAIITSAKDAAGVNIKRQLLKNYGFEEVKGEGKGEGFDGFPVFRLQIEKEEARLFTAAADLIHCENIDKRIPAAELFVFATRHFSSAGVPALTTHSIGNWGKAEFGGRDSTICKSPASLIKLFLQNLAAVAKSEGYNGEVVQEATHHGPYVEKPAAFIEVGSSEKEWSNPKLASMVADSLIGGLGDYVALAEAYENFEVIEAVVALGGLHYASSFNELMLDPESKYAIGHICPKHMLSSLTANPQLLREAMESCLPEAKKVVLDWKGLGKEKQKVKELLDRSNIKYFRV